MLDQQLKCSPESLKLCDINFQGNLIPMPRYQHIKLDSGKADLLAINLLADIVYWYRPIPVRDEQTGQFTGWRQEFKHRWLYFKPETTAERFGCTPRQIKDALIRLEKQNLIKRLYCKMDVDGLTVPNILFIDIKASAIERVTTTQVIKDTNKSIQASQNDTTQRSSINIFEQGCISSLSDYKSENLELSDDDDVDDNNDNHHTAHFPHNMTQDTFRLKGGPDTFERSLYKDTKTTTQIDRQDLSNVILETTGQSVGQKLDLVSNEHANQQQNPLSILQSMMDIWNTTLDQQLVLLNTPKRTSAMLALLKDVFRGDLERWQAYCQQIASTPFLMGQGPKGWRATLDWCLNPINAVKVLQGCYVPQSIAMEGVKSQDQTIDSDLILAQVQQHIAGELNPQMRFFQNYLLEHCGVLTYKNWFMTLKFKGIERDIVCLITNNKLLPGYAQSRFSQVFVKGIKQAFDVKCYDLQVVTLEISSNQPHIQAQVIKKADPVASAGEYSLSEQIQNPKYELEDSSLVSQLHCVHPFADQNNTQIQTEQASIRRCSQLLPMPQEPSHASLETTLAACSNTQQAASSFSITPQCLRPHHTLKG